MDLFKSCYQNDTGNLKKQAGRKTSRAKAENTWLGNSWKNEAGQKLKKHGWAKAEKTSGDHILNHHMVRRPEAKFFFLIKVSKFILSKVWGSVLIQYSTIWVSFCGTFDESSIRNGLGWSQGPLNPKIDVKIVEECGFRAPRFWLFWLSGYRATAVWLWLRLSLESPNTKH